MENEGGARAFLKVGDIVQIVGHKFPELHPKDTLKKVVMKTPGELREIRHRCKKAGDSDMSFFKNSSFVYELAGINCIGLVGEIIEVDLTPRTEREIETGEVAIYVVEFKTKLASWKGKRMTFYPEEVRKIKRGDYHENKDDIEEENEEDYEEEIDQMTQKKLF